MSRRSQAVLGTASLISCMFAPHVSVGAVNFASLRRDTVPRVTHALLIRRRSVEEAQTTAVSVAKPLTCAT